MTSPARQTSPTVPASRPGEGYRSSASYYRRRAVFLSQGLTARGKVRRRRADWCPRGADTPVCPNDARAAERIITLVTNYFCLSLETLRSPARPWSIAWPRFCALHLLRTHTRLPNAYIADLFNRCPKLISHALKKVRDEIQTNPQAAAQLAALETRLTCLTSQTRPKTSSLI